MRNKIIASVLLVALLGGGIYWFQARRSRATAGQGTLIVPAKVQRGTIRATVSGTGPVASVNGVMVKANQGGTVLQILAQDGDRVKAGQVILKLANETLVASMKQAQIDLQNNQSGLANLLNPQETALRAAELKVQGAQITIAQRERDVASLNVTSPISGVTTSVKSVEGTSLTANQLLFTVYDDSTPTFIASVPQHLAAIIKPDQSAAVSIPGLGDFRGKVAQVGATAAPASGNKDATVSVAIAMGSVPGIRPGMVGQASIDVPDTFVQPTGAIENDSVEVRAQVSGTAGKPLLLEGARVQAGDTLLHIENDSVRNSLRQAENDLSVFQQNLQVLRDPIRDPDGQLRTLQNKVEASQITLNTRTQDVGELEVKAPADGLVSALTLRVGDKITNNQSLFRVADYGTMQLTIVVDELDIAKVQVGKPAEITLDALPGRRVTGKVSKINPEGVFKNDIATFEVTILVDNPQGLMAGMNATVNVVTDEKTNVLWLPVQAVKVGQGRATVQIADKGGNTTPKEVKIGLRTSQQVEIVDGLKESEEVVLSIIRPQTQQAGGLGLFGGGQRQQGGNAPGGAGGSTQGGVGGANQGGATQGGGGNRGGGGGR